MALGNRRGGNLILDLTSAPLISGLQRDQLFEDARVCVPKIWGSVYPEEELMDDFENYRGLSLLQISTNLKLSVWRLGIAVKKGSAAADQGSIDRLWAKIESVAQEYYDVLSLARMVKSSSGRRVIYTVYHAALEYDAARVFYSCIPMTNTNTSTSTSTTTGTYEGTNPPWLHATLASLVSIAHKSITEKPELVCRYAWPLCMALLKTTDPVHRGWIREQVGRAGVLLKNMGVPDDVLEALVSEKGIEADIEKLIDSLFTESTRVERGAMGC